MGNVSPPAPLIGGGVRNSGGSPTVLAGGGNLGGMSGHVKLVASSGYHTDGGQRQQATNIVHLADGGAKN